MKRTFALLLAILMLAATLAACGSKTVKTTIDAKYDDGFAKSYADSTSVDSDGNTTYEFTEEQYEQFTNDYRNSVSSDITGDIADTHEEAYGEFAYISEEKKAVIVGVHTDEYDEETAKAEAAIAAENAFRYFQSISNPVSTISVIYCNANNQDEVFGTFEFTL